MVKEITSSDLIPIETHFKVSAGPGSGKTYWLVEHINNVIRTSKRLVPTTKIACITYTNTGVEEIRTRLSGSLEKVEVSTIHNFLYKYLVKPYLNLITDSSGVPIVNVRWLDGHSEHIVNQGFVSQWLKQSRATKIAYDNMPLLMEALSKLRWVVKSDGELELVSSKVNLAAALKGFVKNGNLVDYKKYYWEKGVIHHDDVLYFSLRLIKENPSILTALRYKFPYLFIDEFQDTNPLQTQIVKKLSSIETIVGIIGDPAQSIYSFQGATMQEFTTFSLPGQSLSSYTIRNNRRSSEEIVTLLNHCRGKEGLEQVSIRGKVGYCPKIIVGSFDNILSNVDRKKSMILCLRNDEVGKFKFGTVVSQNNIWNRVFAELSGRARMLHYLVYGIEYVRQKKLTEGLRYILRIITIKAHKLIKKEIAIELIDKVLNSYDELKVYTITQLCNDFIIPFQDERLLKKTAKISRGAKKKFADSITYEQLIQGVNLKDDIASVRTVHKSKGAEFENVTVYIEKENTFKNHVLEADVTTTEDNARIYYVAMSRAKNTLCIALPTLSKENEDLARKIGFGEILRI